MMKRAPMFSKACWTNVRLVVSYGRKNFARKRSDKRTLHHFPFPSGPPSSLPPSGVVFPLLSIPPFSTSTFPHFPAPFTSLSPLPVRPHPCRSLTSFLLSSHRSPSSASKIARLLSCEPPLCIIFSPSPLCVSFDRSLPRSHGEPFHLGMRVPGKRGIVRTELPMVMRNKNHMTPPFQQSLGPVSIIRVGAWRR